MDEKAKQRPTMEDHAKRVLAKIDAIQGPPPDLRPLIIETQTCLLFLYLEKLANGKLQIENHK